MATKRTSHVTVTPYDGDDFPEAASFDEYAGEWLHEHYRADGPCEVKATFGSRNAIYVDGIPEDDASDLLGACWESFVGGGYQDPDCA